MADWNIRPRSTICSACGTPFAIGDKGHSLLLLEGEQWIRQDFCLTCFKNQKERFTHNQTNAWTFIVPPPQKHKPTTEDVVKRETAEHLLRTLIQRNRSQDVGMIYILAILLERNKQFVERRTTFDEEGHRVRMYEQRATGDLFTILDPGLQPADVPALQKRIVALLEGTESLEETEPSLEALLPNTPTVESSKEMPQQTDIVGSTSQECVEEAWPLAIPATDSVEVDYKATDAPMPRDMSLERMHEDVLPIQQRPETMRE